jgi:hypothetical protein
MIFRKPPLFKTRLRSVRSYRRAKMQIDVRVGVVPITKRGKIVLDILVAQIPGQCQVFFNISKNVGIGCPNDPIDVMLVQFGYYCSAINPTNGLPSDLKAIYALVKPGANYSGSPSDPLSQSIIAHERDRGIPQDGHVSRLNGNTNYRTPRGKEGFLLVGLCNNIYDILVNCYPRIDLDGRCPAKLAAHVKTLLRN